MAEILKSASFELALVLWHLCTLYEILFPRIKNILATILSVCAKGFLRPNRFCLMPLFNKCPFSAKTNDRFDIHLVVNW